MSNDLVLLDEVGGLPAAQILAEFLKAQGIEVMLVQESVGSSVFPMTFGRLGMVGLWVKADQYKEAAGLLEQVDADQFVETASTQDEAHIEADSEEGQGKEV